MLGPAEKAGGEGCCYMKMRHPALLLILALVVLAVPGRAQKPAKSDKPACDCGHICSAAKKKCRINPCDGKNGPAPKKSKEKKQDQGSAKKPVITETSNQPVAPGEEE